MNQNESDQIFGEALSFTPSVTGLRVTLPGTKVHELLLKQIEKSKARFDAISDIDSVLHVAFRHSLAEATFTFFAEHLNIDADYLLDRGELFNLGVFDDDDHLKQLANSET